MGTCLFSKEAPIQGINPAILAFSPLIVPCFDVIRVYIYRIRNGSNPFTPDKNHIHHRLLAAGFKQRSAMVMIVLSSVMLCVLNIVLSLFININLVIIIDIALWTLAIILISRRIYARTGQRV